MIKVVIWRPYPVQHNKYYQSGGSNGRGNLESSDPPSQRHQQSHQHKINTFIERA